MIDSSGIPEPKNQAKFFGGVDGTRTVKTKIEELTPESHAGCRETRQSFPFNGFLILFSAFGLFFREGTRVSMEGLYYNLLL